MAEVIEWTEGVGAFVPGNPLVGQTAEQGAKRRRYRSRTAIPSASWKVINTCYAAPGRRKDICQLISQDSPPSAENA